MSVDAFGWLRARARNHYVVHIAVTNHRQREKIDMSTKRITLINAGRRIAAGGKLAYAYSAPDEKDLRLYAGKLNGRGVGVAFDYTVDGDNDRRLFTSGKDAPTFNDAVHAPVEQANAWVAADGAVALVLAEQRAVRRYEKELESPLRDALATLKAAVDAQRGYADRAAVVSWIVAELNK